MKKFLCKTKNAILSVSEIKFLLCDKFVDKDLRLYKIIKVK